MEPRGSSDGSRNMAAGYPLLQQASPPPLVRVRLRTFPAMMLASALILTCEAFAINYVSSPSPLEQMFKRGEYTVEFHDPLVAERTLEVLKDWGLSNHNLRHIYFDKTPIQTDPPRLYHGKICCSNAIARDALRRCDTHAQHAQVHGHARVPFLRTLMW